MAPETNRTWRNSVVLHAVVVFFVVAQLGGAVLVADASSPDERALGSEEATIDPSIRGSSSVGGGFAARPIQEQPPKVCGRSIEGLVTSYNENVERIPRFFLILVNDRKVHLVVNGAGGGDYTFVTDSDGRVESYTEGKPPDAPVRMETDCDTMRELISADDPVDTFWDAYWNDEIEFHGNGLLWGIFVEAIEFILLLTHTFSGAGLSFWVALGLAVIVFLVLVAIAGGIALVLLYRAYTHFVRPGIDEAVNPDAQLGAESNGDPEDEELDADQGTE